MEDFEGILSIKTLRSIKIQVVFKDLRRNYKSKNHKAAILTKVHINT